MQLYFNGTTPEVKKNDVFPNKLFIVFEGKISLEIDINIERLVINYIDALSDDVEEYDYNQNDSIESIFKCITESLRRAKNGEVWIYTEKY